MLHQDIKFSHIDDIPDNPLNLQDRHNGVICFVDEEMAKIIHLANLTNEKYDFSKLEKKKHTLLTSLRKFTDLNPGIKLLPINIDKSRSDQFLDRDLDEIELFIKTGGQFLSTEIENETICHFGHLDNSLEPKIKDRLKKINSEIDQKSKPSTHEEGRQKIILQNLKLFPEWEGLPDLIKTRLNEIKTPAELARSIQVELSRLAEWNIWNTTVKKLKTLLENIPHLETPTKSPIRAFTTNYANKLLDYVNDRNLTRSNKDKLTAAGNLAHLILHAEDKESFAHIIDEINRQIDLLEKSDPHSTLIRLLKNMRNEFGQYKFTSAMPINSFTNEEQKKHLSELLNSVKNLNNISLSDSTQAPSWLGQQRSHIDVAMSEETRKKYNAYLNTIKEKIKKGQLDFREKAKDQNIIGKALFKILKKYYEYNDNNIDSMLNMSVDLFINCVLKTTITHIFAEHDPRAILIADNDKKLWELVEHQLLANTSRIVKNVTALTKTTFRPKTEDIIQHNQPKTDFLFINSPIISYRNRSLDFQIIFDNPDDFDQDKIEFDYQKDDFTEQSKQYFNEFFTKNFNYARYKEIIKERLLSALIQLNNEHPEGFILTLPALGCVSFAEGFKLEIKPKFEKGFKEFLEEYQAQLPNLKAVIYTDNDSEKNKTELINKIPFISTNRKIGTAPQCDQEIFDDVPNITEEYKTYLLDNKKCAVVTIIAGDEFSKPKNEYNDNLTSSHEAGLSSCTTIGTVETGEEGQLVTNKDTEIVSYQPKNKRNWRNCYPKDGIQVGKINVVWNILDRTISSAPIDSEEKVKRLCGVCEALCQSKNSKNRIAGHDLKTKYLTAKTIDQYVNSTAYQIQFFLTQLSEVQTKNKEQKSNLIKKLSRLLARPESIDEDFLKVKFHKIIDKTILDLKLHTETRFTRLFDSKAFHYLRGFIEENRKKIPLPSPQLKTVTREELMNLDKEKINNNLTLKLSNNFHYIETGEGAEVLVIKDLGMRRVILNGVENLGLSPKEQTPTKVREQLPKLLNGLDADILINAHRQIPFLGLLASTSTNYQVTLSNTYKDQYFTDKNELHRILSFPPSTAIITDGTKFNIDSITFHYKYVDLGVSKIFISKNKPTEENINNNTYVFFKENEKWQCGFKYQGTMVTIEGDDTLDTLLANKSLINILEQEGSMLNLLNELIHGELVKPILDNRIPHRISDSSDEETEREALINSIDEFTEDIVTIPENNFNQGDDKSVIIPEDNKEERDNFESHSITPEVQKLADWIKARRYGMQLVDIKTADPFFLRVLNGQTFTAEEIKTYADTGKLPEPEAPAFKLQQ